MPKLHLGTPFGARLRLAWRGRLWEDLRWARLAIPTSRHPRLRNGISLPIACPNGVWARARISRTALTKRHSRLTPIPCPLFHANRALTCQPWPSDGRADVLSLPYTAPVARNRQFCRRSGSQSGRSSAMNICPIVTARDKPRPNCGLRLFFRDGHTCLGSWTGEIWKSVTGREVHPERWQIDLPLGFQGRF